MKLIETERLILRTWQPEDAQCYFLINQDAKVIEHLRGPLTSAQVTAFIDVANRQQALLGYAFWAAELKQTSALIGFIGLNNTDFLTALGAHFTPAVEIGWRLGSQYWGNGYATEGAKAALNYAFASRGLEEIVSFTVPANQRSISVMQRIGMRQDLSGDFAHPKFALNHRLSKHLLYRLTKPLWEG